MIDLNLKNYMKPQKINNLESYNKLVEKFSKRETLTNNYMLPAQVSAIIDECRLYCCYDNTNCFFLVKKEANIYRFYYLLNDIGKKFNIESEGELVSEILYRGNMGEPKDEIEYLKSNGFEFNIKRDQFAGLIPNISETEIIYAKTKEDVLESINLFNATFDKYSGDYISINEVENLYKTKSILCSYDNSGNIQGFLQTNILGRNAWVAHLVVDSKYRGKGVANNLMDMFVANSIRNDCRRLMLWVNHENEAAISLYHKYGLNYANKSTISLIKK